MTVKVVNEVVRDPISHKIRQIFSEVSKPSGNLSINEPSVVLSTQNSSA